MMMVIMMTMTMMMMMMMIMMVMMMMMMMIMMMMADRGSWPKNWRRHCRQRQPLHGRTRLPQLNAVDPLRDTILPPVSFYL